MTIEFILTNWIFMYQNAQCSKQRIGFIKIPGLFTSSLFPPRLTMTSKLLVAASSSLEIWKTEREKKIIKSISHTIAMHSIFKNKKHRLSLTSTVGYLSQ